MIEGADHDRLVVAAHHRAGHDGHPLAQGHRSDDRRLRGDVAGGGNDRDEVAELIDGHFVETSSVLGLLNYTTCGMSSWSCRRARTHGAAWLGRIAHRSRPPFATLPSVHNLAAEVHSVTRGKHERS